MGRMIAFIIFYCVFSTLVFGAFLSTGLDPDEDMLVRIKVFIISFLGPIAFPFILGCALYKLIFSV